jgi:NAD(P)-dependent dehydrogenase (short-subunit alcohol dehydrogenase family)
MEIKGKTAIITGSTGKLAGAIVLALAQAGAQCICIYHKNGSQAKRLGAALNKLKAKSIFIEADLTVPENIGKVFADIKKFAKPQILINAAAVFEKKPIEDITFDYIRQILDINFSVSMMMSKKFVEFVRQKIRNKQKPSAKIINITDAIIQKPPAGFSIYCASKSALAAATKSLAKELAPDFTVNAVAPGIVNWPFDFAQDREKIISRIPAARAAKPQEIAHAVKFLIENDYLTGQVINVDGGWTG